MVGRAPKVGFAEGERAWEGGLFFAQSTGALYKQASAGMFGSDSTAIHSEWKNGKVKDWHDVHWPFLLPILTAPNKTCQTI